MSDANIVKPAPKKKKTLDSFFLSEFQNKKLVLIIISLIGFFLMFILAFTPNLDPDLGWHLKTGELMWQYQTIPHTDWYSYTMPDFAWIDHEWLTELFMFKLYQYSGMAGLNVFFTLLVVAVYGFLVGEAVIKKPRWENRIILGILAILVATAFTGARPQMFTLFFVSLILILIKRLHQNEKTKSIWLLPLLFLFWVNMHASFLAGFGILAVYLLTEKIKIGRLEKLGENEWITKSHTLTKVAWNKLALASILSLPAIFLNPYSYKILIELKRTFTDPFAPNFIMEWLTPNFHQMTGLLFLFLVFLFLEILFLSKKKIDPTQFILITIFLWMGFQANRHIPLFALVLLPFLLETMENVPEVITLGVLKNKFILTSFIFFFALYALQFSYLSQTIAFLLDPKSSAASQGYPENAIEFLKNHPQSGNVFNNYGWGGYIIQNSKFKIQNSKIVNENENMKVFIDGRMAHWKTKDREILKEYADIYSISDNFDEQIEKYKIYWVFVEKNSYMGKILALKNDWKTIYSDDQAIILRKIE